MAMRRDNMEGVADWGEALPEEWFKVRVDKVQDQDENGQDILSESSKQPICKIWLKVQDEPFVGRVIFDMPSLQAQALAKLKAYYKAVGYAPGPEGHDPQKITGGELFVKVTHETYQGQIRMKVAPYNIRSLMEGRPAA